MGREGTGRREEGKGAEAEKSIIEKGDCRVGSGISKKRCVPERGRCVTHPFTLTHPFTSPPSLPPFPSPKVHDARVRPAFFSFDGFPL